MCISVLVRFVSNVYLYTCKFAFGLDTQFYVRIAKVYRRKTFLVDFFIIAATTRCETYGKSYQHE